MFSRFLSILFLVFISFSLYAQFDIKGQVLDMENKTLEYIEVILLESDSSAISSELTDTEGFFNIRNIKKGDYIVIIRSFSGNLDSRGIKVEDHLDLGVINVNNSVTLEEVVITSQKPVILRKIDRMVFNVERSPLASNGDALDALRVTPGVQVQNDVIAMIGKSAVAVMVNDRVIQLSGEDLVSYLQSISSSDIKNIEVITTPPAKYSAEGNSGLINIRLKGPKRDSWGNSVRMSYIQTSYPAATLGNSFHYNKNKFSLSTSLDGKIGRQGTENNYEIFFPNARNVSQLNFENRQEYLSGRVGWDYNVSEKASIGGIIQYYKSVPNSDEDNSIDIFDDNNNLTSYILTDGETEENKSTQSYNLHYIQQLDTLGKSLSIDVDYFKFDEYKGRYFASLNFSPDGSLVDQFIADNEGSQDINNYSAKIDFIHPTKLFNITYGSRFTFTNTNSDVNFYDLNSGTPILDTSQSDNFEYKENIQSAYFDIAKSFGEKWQSKIGLRFESTQTTGTSRATEQVNKNRYNKVFPTFYLLYTANDKNTINLNYSRRINRPAFWELNPFRWYTSSNFYSEGNPFLQPSFNDNFELTYQHNQKYYATFFAEITSDGYGQIPEVDPATNQQIYLRDNYHTGYSYGLTQVFLFTKYSWWTHQLYGSVFYMTTKIKPEFEQSLPVRNGINANFSIYNAFSLNKKGTIRGEISYWYAPTSNLLIYKQSQSMSLNVGLKFSLLNKSLQCGISAYDILKTSNPTYTTYSNNVKQLYNNYYDSRQVKISVKYTFGNQNNGVRNRDFGNEVEQNRVE